MIMRGHRVKAGKVEGEAIVTRMPFSYLGDLDVRSGKVTKGHELEGQSITDKILVIPTGKGSTGGALIGYYAKFFNTAPRGMICVQAEPVIALNAIMNDIPTVDRLDRDPLEVIETGDYVKLDATDGIVEVIKKVQEEN